jgi:spore cortex formation protein SpoVR/YcgB (stage V sporulation)
MYECYFSGEKTRESYMEYYSPDVKAIQRIVKLYGAAEVREILETTCLRNKTQRGYKINKILKKDENVALTKEKVLDEIKETVEEQPAPQEKKLTRSQKKKL